MCLYLVSNKLRYQYYPAVYIRQININNLPRVLSVYQFCIYLQELGTPNEKIWPGVSELPAMKKVAFTDYPFNKLRNRFGTLITERGFDLMNR